MALRRRPGDHKGFGHGNRVWKTVRPEILLFENFTIVPLTHKRHWDICHKPLDYLQRLSLIKILFENIKISSHLS